MESGNIHDQMAQYDFKAPIEVTMIFEENEEDELTELSTTKLGNIKNFDEENEYKNISDLTDVNKTNIELTNISTPTILEKTKHMSVNDNSDEIRAINADKRMTENYSLKRKPDNECELNKKSKKLSNINEGEISISDGNTNNKHLNDLDNATLMEINAKIFEELLKTVSEHLLLIIKEHSILIQFQNDKSTNLSTLDRMKQCYVRLKYHYFNLSYCTVSTILLPQEKNTGFIGRFLNHTLKLSKEKAMICTYNILDGFYIEMISWVKMKKKYLSRFSSNISNLDENIMLKQQLLYPPKKMSFSNSNISKQVENTLIFTSGPPGRQVHISIEPSLIHQNTNTTQPIGDTSSLIHKNGQPLPVEPPSIYENNQHSMVEKSLAEQSLIQNSQQNSFTPYLDQQNRQHVSGEISSTQQFITDTTSFQQNSNCINVEPSLPHQNTPLHTLAEPASIYQNRQQNYFKPTDSSIQRNIQHPSPLQVPVNEFNKQYFSNQPSSFQQNRQQINVEPPLSHREKIRSDPSFFQQKKQRNRKRTSASTIQQNNQHVVAEQMPIHQIIPQTAVQQILIHQNRQPHPSLQSTGTLNQGFQNNNKYVMQPPNQYQNYMNCNFGHYTPLSYANYPTYGRPLQQHPAADPSRYPPNVVPNYGTAPRAGPLPPNYYDPLYRHHQPHNHDTSNQIRHLPQEYYNQEPVTENSDVLPPNIDTTRSSVSKDSGIMSPLCFETSTDQLSLPLIEDLLPSPNATPVITHVTSLHPNASHIIKGNCVVCQKSTNSKCLGCYKLYYCSHECQKKDWKSHKYTCRA